MAPGACRCVSAGCTADATPSKNQKIAFMVEKKFLLQQKLQQIPELTSSANPFLMISAAGPESTTCTFWPGFQQKYWRNYCKHLEGRYPLPTQPRPSPPAGFERICGREPEMPGLQRGPMPTAPVSPAPAPGHSICAPHLLERREWATTSKFEKGGILKVM